MLLLQSAHWRYIGKIRTISKQELLPNGIDKTTRWKHISGFAQLQKRWKYTAETFQIKKLRNVL